MGALIVGPPLLAVDLACAAVREPLLAFAATATATGIGCGVARLVVLVVLVQSMRGDR